MENENAVIPMGLNMPTETDTETREEEVEVFKGDGMEIMIQVAAKLEEYEKALNTIINFIVRRTYAGDWVSFDKANTPIADRTVNMIGAAAERIARDLGVQESNRTQPIKKMNEKFPGHYAYECDGDFTFRGRTVHAQGVASTRNPFHSRVYSEDKKPEEIREDYIMRESWRDCTKQGIKMLFGLRRVPLLKLKELGYDISQVKYVNFQEGEKSASKTKPEATAVPQEAESPVQNGETIAVTVEKMTPGTTKKSGKPFYKVTDHEGVMYFIWGDDKSERVKRLLVAYRDKKQVQVIWEKRGEFNTINDVVEVASNG